jgi:hypothetical protein
MRYDSAACSGNPPTHAAARSRTSLPPLLRASPKGSSRKATPKPRGWLLAVLAWGLSALAPGCDVRTSIGSTCANGKCARAVECNQSQQQFPDGCSKSTHMCHRAAVEPDPQVCGSCMQTLDRLHIGAAIAPCACTFCAVQLRGCFESADYEPNGDPQRDADCRKIVECGWANDCAGSDCYCGFNVDRDTCLRDANAGHARGPCAELIEALVECDPDTPKGTCIFANQQTLGAVLNRATDIALCVTGDPLLPSHTIEPQCPLPPRDASL